MRGLIRVTATVGLAALGLNYYHEHEPAWIAQQQADLCRVHGFDGSAREFRYKEGNNACVVWYADHTGTSSVIVYWSAIVRDPERWSRISGFLQESRCHRPSDREEQALSDDDQPLSM